MCLFLWERPEKRGSIDVFAKVFVGGRRQSAIDLVAYIFIGILLKTFAFLIFSF
jgi:hypothetical protein